LCILLPLLAAAVLAVAGGALPRRMAPVLGVGSVAASSLVVTFLATTIPSTSTAWRWIEVSGLHVDLTLHMDSLSAVLALVVTWVGLCIHLYSVAFMAKERDLARFFASMNLFVASMLVLVLAQDLLLLYMGWEGVGLCSFLLIGFWYEDRGNVAAARKAFVVTRIGDAALAVGLLLLVTQLGTLQLPELLQRASHRWASGDPYATAAAALLLAGAVGKSAQLPLQIWLPDAMAGPTPVSALIHAATMVTAGVFLLARTHELFALAPAVLHVVAVLGVTTLLLAAASAATQRDIKRVLAWSTISQLGYMFLALGVGAWSAAIFHLVTHAFFKALLFLGAGSVILRLHHEHDIAAMGGLRRALPLTFWTFLAGGAALAGVPLVTAGFYSKDTILASAFAAPGGVWLWIGGLLGVALTSAYVFRLVLRVFFGRVRHAPEGRTPVLLAAPLVVLGVLSVLGGLPWMPAWLGGFDPLRRFLSPSLGEAHALEAAASTEALLALATATMVAAGFGAAWWRFGRGRDAVDWGLGDAFERWWRGGFGFDALYHRLFVLPWRAVTRTLSDEPVDRAVEALAWVMTRLHRALRATQTGRVRWYAGGLAAGALVLVVLGWWS
jgi:NADH-quinone oxidoreductase subunit L